MAGGRAPKASPLAEELLVMCGWRLTLLCGLGWWEAAHAPVDDPTALWIRAALDELRGLLITIFVLKGHAIGRERGRGQWKGFREAVMDGYGNYRSARRFQRINVNFLEKKIPGMLCSRCVSEQKIQFSSWEVKPDSKSYLLLPGLEWFRLAACFLEAKINLWEVIVTRQESRWPLSFSHKMSRAQ